MSKFAEEFRAEIKSAVAEALAEAGITGGKAASTGGTAAGGKGGTTGGKGGSAKKPKHTAEEVKAIAIRVKDEIDMDTAKSLIKEHGKADELASIKPENFDAFYAACETALEGDGDGDDGGL